VEPKEQEMFDKAMATIKSQQAQLVSLTAPVYPTGTIVAVFEKSVMVEVGAAIFECERPTGTAPDWIGATVMVHPKTGQVVKRSNYVRYGQTATIMQIEGKMIFLNTPNGQTTTEYSAVPIEALAPGDRVVMNHTNLVILQKSEVKSKYAFVAQTPLDWSDIGGCAEAKAELQKALEFPYTHAKVFNFFHKKRVKGGVLWGRPGMGKTLLGRACAGSIIRTHKADPESFATAFIYVKGPELLVKWVGDTEQAIRDLFEHAKQHFLKWHYPAVIFLDEADAFLTRRGTRTASGMETTVVPQFNAEMDGMEESGAFVLVATNRVEILDPAIIRPGRCDRKFHIAPPTIETAPEILEIHMRNVPIAHSGWADVQPCSKEQIIKTSTERFFSDKYPLYKLETDKGTRIFGLSNLASGAMLAGLVERATSYAIDRNLENPDPDGVNLGDFDLALEAIHKEQFGLNHYDELKEYIDTERLVLRNLVQCRSAEEVAAPMPQSETPETRVLAVAVPSGSVYPMSDADKKKVN
jgi:proteasome-associated ATPase